MWRLLKQTQRSLTATSNPAVPRYLFLRGYHTGFRFHVLRLHQWVIPLFLPHTHTHTELFSNLTLPKSSIQHSLTCFRRVLPSSLKTNLSSELSLCDDKKSSGLPPETSSVSGRSWLFSSSATTSVPRASKPAVAQHRGFMMMPGLCPEYQESN